MTAEIRAREYPRRHCPPGIFSRAGTEKKRKEEVPNKFIYEDVEEKLKNILGTKVSVNHKKNNKGKIEIEYYSMDELDRIMDLFRTIEK